MNSFFKHLYSLLFLFLISVSLAKVNIYAQDLKSPASKRDTLLHIARQYIHDVRFCSLITIDSSGFPHARTMDPFLPDENMIVWFGTNRNSRKVKEISNNSKVTLYYSDNKGEGYVSIIGTASLVNIPNKKDSLWKDEWSRFYNDKKENYLLIKVVPKKLEILNYKQGLFGNKETWRTPFVIF
jgi:general stress protein 26